MSRPSGTVVEEVVHPVGASPGDDNCRTVTVPLVRAGEVTAHADLQSARDLVASGLRSLPWEGLALSRGEPAIRTRQVPAR